MDKDSDLSPPYLRRTYFSSSIGVYRNSRVVGIPDGTTVTFCGSYTRYVSYSTSRSSVCCHLYTDSSMTCLKGWGDHSTAVVTPDPRFRYSSGTTSITGFTEE